MQPPPVIDTSRLRLQALAMQQASRLAMLADEPLIAANTAAMPSPYTEAHAQAFITRAASTTLGGDDLVYGIHLQTGELAGVLNMKIQQPHRSGHIGYWLGADFRGRGYMTEAVMALMDYGFQHMALQRIQTACFASNRASARVLERAGMQHEGCRRQAFCKNGVFEDLLLFGALREDWMQGQGMSSMIRGQGGS